MDFTGGIKTAALFYNVKQKKIMNQSAGQPIKRWELIELVIPAGTTGKVTFDSKPQLRNQENQIIVIKDIEAFDVTAVANSSRLNGMPGMPITDVPKAMLVLYVNGEESVHYIPLAKLIHTTNGTNEFAQNWAGLDDLSNVDIDQSYVWFTSASDETEYVIPFGINYIRYQKDPSDPDKYIQK